MDKLLYKRFLLVKDDFYDDPKRVLKAALEAEYHQPEHVTGYRSRTVYHEPGVKKKIEKILGIKITRWDIDPNEENGVFYQAFAAGKRKEIPGVHSDEPYNDVTVLVYLTPGMPYDCGTSMWQHKETGLTDPVTPQDARKLKRKWSVIKQQLEDDFRDRDKWIEIDRVGNKFNRMIAFPSGALHSATNHFGSGMNNGRLFQTFRIGVDWSSLKMFNV